MTSGLQLLLKVLEPFLPLIMLIGAALLLYFMAPMLAVAAVILVIILVLGGLIVMISEVLDAFMLPNPLKGLADDVKASVSDIEDQIAILMGLGSSKEGLGPGFESEGRGLYGTTGEEFAGTGPSTATYITIQGDVKDEETIEEIELSVYKGMISQFGTYGYGKGRGP